MNRHMLRTAIATSVVAVAFSALPWSVSSAAEAPAPTGLRAVSTSRDAISLSWDARSGVDSYLVEYDTAASMTSPKPLRVDSPNAELTGLQPGQTYYLRSATLSVAGLRSSAYSTAVAIATRPANGYPLLAPAGLRVVEQQPGKLSLVWAARAGAARYRVSWATNASFEGAGFWRTDTNRLDLTGLSAGTRYFLRVRVIDQTGDGAGLSEYSPAIQASTTAPAVMARVTNLAVSQAAKAAIALRWARIEGASSYQIQVSTSSKMTKARLVATSSAEPSGEVSGLVNGRTYYLRVRAVSTLGVGPYGPIVRTRTATAAAATYLAPVIVAKAPAAAKLTVSWASRGNNVRYQIQIAPDASMKGASVKTVPGLTLSLGGLKPATTYYLRARVVTTAGAARSEFSPVMAASTSQALPVPLRVATYNVRCASCYDGNDPGERPWTERRDAVAQTILGQRPDVIGVQEASQGRIKENGKSINRSQFEDLAMRLGSPYKLANTHRYNCVKSTTPTNCVYRDQGASLGTKILYNADVLTLISQGSKKLPRGIGNQDRYLAWAILEHQQSGRRFIFGSTHLQNGYAAEYNQLRIAQTQALLATLAEINPGGELPVYVVGDFNSHKWTTPSNAAYDEMLAGGFVDPLGNSYKSTKTTFGAIVGKRIRTNFSSFNGFAAKAPAKSYINGTYLDYIFTSQGIDVPEWETVVNVDADGNFVGVIPSDHNMLRADTVLP